MRLPLLLATAIFAGCYAPDAADCRLACAVDTDCVSGQTCNSDHLCAGPGVASCSDRTVGDAGTPGLEIDVMISGGGSVTVSAGSDCASGTCTYHVAPNTTVTVTAVDHGSNVFNAWSSAPCMGQGRTCQFTATTPVTKVSVTFDHDS